LSSGLSDHFGVNEGLGLMLLNLSKTNHAPAAATVIAFSTYLTALGIHILLAAILRLGAAPDLTANQYS
jgi:uncharacterized protein (DUF2062 family)